MTKEEKKQFGERLRNLAFWKGVTQVQIAEDINISRQNVSCWIFGKSIPRGVTLMKLCEYFGCTAEYLLYGKGTAQGQKEEQEKTGISLEELALAVVEMRDLLREIRDSFEIRRDDMK